MIAGNRRFVCLTNDGTARIIRGAQTRVVIAAPGISVKVASALIEAVGRELPVHVVVDCNDDVCRLGYGEVEALRKLLDAGIQVMQSPGLRAGVLIVDGEAWSFTPTPLSVEAERQGNETPNAVRLGREAAAALLRALAPAAESRQEELPIFGPTTAEVGATPLSQQELKETEQSLAEVPPMNFDLQRQVRVFQPYIQYVELSLTGAAISRHKVTLPSALAPLAKRAEVQKKLTTSFDLLDGTSKLSEKPLNEELDGIRKAFLRPIKALNGSVMLRGKTTALNERLKKLQDNIDKHKEKISKGLAKEIERSLLQLHRELLPLVMRRPPQDLVNGCFGEKPTKEEAARWLEHALRKEFPTAEEVVSEIKLKCVFKDVTYQSLTQAGLQDELKNAFPAVPWEKPFHDFNAVEESRGPQKELNLG